jgi:tryptophan 2,3-dioxygenase
MATPLSYWDYLRLDDLLSLQNGRGDAEDLNPDELHFIVVHQAFELWFKLTLSQLRLARNALSEKTVAERTIPYVVHHLGRVNSILELCGKQFEVMETLTPQDFLAFRNSLVPSSGFQSFQMREIEILLGLKDTLRVIAGVGHPLEVIRRSAGDSDVGRRVVARIDAALKEMSLREALHGWLYRTPIQGSSPGDPGDDAAVAQFVEDYLAASVVREEAFAAHLVRIGTIEKEAADRRFGEARERSRAFLTAADLPEGTSDEDRRRMRRVRAALLFIESYRELPLLAWPRLLLDSVVELEEKLVLFRTRHARMVERIIGRRPGTGGSAGVDYLDATTKYRVFTELWAVRSLLLPKSALPPLLNKESYLFASQD